jgi:hypothetical protein
VAALAGVAGHAVQTASYLRLAAANLPADGGPKDAFQAFEEQRSTVLYECAEALHELRRARLPWALPALEPDGENTEGLTERRSPIQRRSALNRRRHPDDSPPARVNRWLHGERRTGKDRRSGDDRRAEISAAVG